jgi:hypothetical protein
MISSLIELVGSLLGDRYIHRVEDRKKGRRSEVSFLLMVWMVGLSVRYWALRFGWQQRRMY